MHKLTSINANRILDKTANGGRCVSVSWKVNEAIAAGSAKHMEVMESLQERPR